MLPVITTAKGESPKPSDYHSKWESDRNPQVHSPKSKQRPPANTPLAMPSFTGDKDDGKVKLEDRSGLGGGIGGWFTGTSTNPVTVAVLGEESASPPTAEEMIATTTPNFSPSHSPSSSRDTIERTASTSSNMPSSSSSDKTITQTTTPSPSRFAFFSRSTPTPKAVQVPTNVDDELLHLDISAALFPNVPADPFSPSSFKNLLMNAEALLTKLQTAYKVRTLAVHELTREKEAQSDELREAETRAAHLKLQLEDMGKKLIQQDHDILAISNELAVEKQLRAEERAASEQQISKIEAQSAETSHNRTGERLVSRGSRSSFESYNLDDSDSVFSHSRSHISTSSAGTGITTPEIVALDSDNKSIVSKASNNTSTTQKPSTNARSSLPQPKSVFSKFLGGSNTSAPDTSIASRTEDETGLGLSEMGCANCRGGSSSVAWDAVGLLRAENKGLKDRVGLLEDGVDDVLGLIRSSLR